MNIRTMLPGSMLCLVTMLPGLLFAQAGRDPVEDAMEAFNKQVAVAKKQFDGSVERTTQNTIKRLVALADGAIRNKNEDLAAKAWKEVLRLDRAHGQARAFFQQRNKLDVVLTQLTVEWEPLVLVEPEAREQQVFFECMLGRYQADKTWLAAVTLVIPDGGNVFNDVVRQRAASGSGDPSSGKLTFYDGTGTLLVPADGDYAFTGPARVIKLNGQELSEIREKPVSVPLKKGIYSIEVTADLRYTERVAVSVVDPRNGQRLPIFNSLAQIRNFLLEPNEANGPRRFDVSRFSPEQAMPLRISVPQQKAQ